MNKMEQRIYLGKQPARVLLVDLSSPLDEDMCGGLVASLERCFSLLCSLAGPPRLSFFGLYALGAHPEALLPLQPTKGSFCRIQSALNELPARLREFSANQHQRTCGCIAQGVQEAAAMFKRQAHGLIQTSCVGGGGWSLYEITVITCQMNNSVLRQVEKASRHVEADHLKKLQVLHVCNTDRIAILGGIEEGLEGSGEEGASQGPRTTGSPGASQGPRTTSSPGSGSDQSQQSDGSVSTALIDSVTIDYSGTALESFFRGWLHDMSTDSEHVQLILPSPGRGPRPEGLEPREEGLGPPGEEGAEPGDEEEDEPLVLKCDVQERILDPNLLPFAYQFSVHPEVTGMRLNPTPATVKGGGISVPVHRLTVVNRLPLTGVCESVLHGMPLILKATTCWKVEWDELEANQNHFLSLCKQLLSQNEVLLCQLDEEPVPPSSRPGSGFRYHIPQPKPRGYFLVLPSHSSTLLIKSVADGDLVLPADVTTADMHNSESEATVRNSLNKVAALPMFNPLLLSSGLSECLSVQLTRSAPPGGLKRKIPIGSSSGPPTQTAQPTPERGRGNYPGFRNVSQAFRGQGSTRYGAASTWNNSNQSAVGNFNQPGRGNLNQSGSGNFNQSANRNHNQSERGNFNQSGSRNFNRRGILNQSGRGDFSQSGSGSHPQRKKVRFPDDCGDSFYSEPPGGGFPSNL